MPKIEEEDIYDEEVDEELEEADEIDELEEGFMKGYNEDIDPTKCANCKRTLKSENVVEEEIKGGTYYFCSEKCATNFKHK